MVEKRVIISLMYKEIVVSLADLRYLSIECPICHTKVTLDMKDKSELAKKYAFFTPIECPGCQTKYDTAIPQTIDSFQKSYASLLEIAERISFHGPVEKES